MNLLMLACYGLLLWVVIVKRSKFQELARVVGSKLQGKDYSGFVYILVSIIFTLCVGVKFFNLANSGPIIPNELIKPIDLSPLGKQVFTDLVEGRASSIEGLNCDESRSCSSDLELINSRIMYSNKFLLNNFSNSKNITDWVKHNSILVNETAAWRGRYIHHYSTILFPLREIRNGKISYAFTSQYGLVSLLPLLFIKNLPFIYYGLISLVSLLVFGLYVLYKNKNITTNFLLIGSLLSLLILCTNIDALRLSPGFAYFRYLPLAILLYQFSIQIEDHSMKNYIFWMVLGVLNSTQFNILFIVITLIWFLLTSIKRKKIHSFITLKMTFVVAVIVAIQLALFLYQKNSFTPELFSSVGEAPFSFGYTLKILLLPIALLAVTIAFGVWNWKVEKFNNDQIILACVIYGLCATYAMSFPKSPQHYVGFILMAFFGIYILLKNSSFSIITTICSIAILFSTPYYYKYLRFNHKYIEAKSDFYEYKNKLGASIYFLTAIDVKEVSSEYDQLISKYEDSGKIYFISKDKIFIEMAQDKNIDPKVYDVYTNYLGVTPDIALEKLRNDGVTYVVLDNFYLTEYIIAMNKLFRIYLGNHEYLSHEKILLNIRALSRDKRIQILECTQSYCIYKI